MIINLVNSFNLNERQSSREMSIYLPTNSPNQPVRLIATVISHRTVLILLCGEQPTTKQIQENIVDPLRSSQKDQEVLRRIVHENRHIPQIDENIITLVALHPERNTYTIMGGIDVVRQRDLIRLIEMSYKIGGFKFPQAECYVDFKKYKGYFSENRNSRLYFLFPVDLNLEKMRKIASKTQLVFSKEKR